MHKFFYGYRLHFSWVYKVCTESIQPCIRKIETFIEEDTRYKKHRTQDNDASVRFKVGTLGTSHSFPNHHQLPCCIFLNLIDSLKSLPFQRWFYFWEKPEVAGGQTWAGGVLSHLGDLMFHKKTLHKIWCMSRHVVVMKLSIASCP